LNEFLVIEISFLALTALMFFRVISRAGQITTISSPPNIMPEEKIFQAPGWTVGAAALIGCMRTSEATPGSQA
jgi:hypothetical protein